MDKYNCFKERKRNKDLNDLWNSEIKKNRDRVEKEWKIVCCKIKKLTEIELQNGSNIFS
jgi:hypothetical protein